MVAVPTITVSSGRFSGGLLTGFVNGLDLHKAFFQAFIVKVIDAAALHQSDVEHSRLFVEGHRLGDTVVVRSRIHLRIHGIQLFSAEEGTDRPLAQCWDAQDMALLTLGLYPLEDTRLACRERQQLDPSHRQIHTDVLTPIIKDDRSTGIIRLFGLITKIHETNFSGVESQVMQAIRHNCNAVVEQVNSIIALYIILSSIL